MKTIMLQIEERSMKKIFYTCFLLVSVLLVGSCASTADFYEEDVDQSAAETDASDVDIMALEEDCKEPCLFPRSALEDPASALAGRLIFFEYDSADIKSEYQELLIAHAQYLISYPDTKIRLEGHTDERGSREYNLGLGEERAKSVRRLLLIQGVGDSSIQVVSFGEELPLDLGHDESAWQQNRRVELVYEEE